MHTNCFGIAKESTHNVTRYLRFLLAQVHEKLPTNMGMHTIPVLFREKQLEEYLPKGLYRPVKNAVNGALYTKSETYDHDQIKIE